ncbi:hypothetical protein B0H10DRAFT_1967749 [Mycena sp. CBHHK59/15]|nr:hypothetical protein B0H10DRAFT_1967749 [Mycena sp. CBHHK59/15]
MKDWPQCTGCSVQLKLLKGPRCGACTKKGTQDQNRLDVDSTTATVQELQADARRNAMLARTLQKSKTPATCSASLQVAVAKGAPHQITIYLVPVTLRVLGQKRPRSLQMLLAHSRKTWQ